MDSGSLRPEAMRGVERHDACEAACCVREAQFQVLSLCHVSTGCGITSAQ